ncbi:tRNA glutamyl-Q(34) synthetase GluQRS [Neisseriaceae bacterium ESL0693]|nr:tRNA glutamyl-Q(34) synthetase GluQRS [Neisseriaceae bacterium ESL0693]
MNNTQTKGYVGRFAPSPTGKLHIGSLLTAVASFLDARHHQGRWLVRMEDLDPPREVAGAADAILRTLEHFGLYWDGEVVYQSRRHDLYQAALSRLQQNHQVYPCYCSRKTVLTEARGQGIDGAIYSGHCAQAKPAETPDKIPAWRIRVPDQMIAFTDAVVSGQQQNLARQVGDFVLRRADGFWAYQLAVVVDDAEQGVNHVVRGQDLLLSTPRQIYLQQQLGYTVPMYAHLPLLTNALGQKWSKQTHAPALNEAQREALLRQVLRYLGLGEAPAVDHVSELLLWATGQWQMPKTGCLSIITTDV